MTHTDEDQDVDAAIATLMETCDCAACERLRRAERRAWITPLYQARLEMVLGQPSLRGGRR